MFPGRLATFWGGSSGRILWWVGHLAPLLPGCPTGTTRAGNGRDFRPLPRLPALGEGQAVLGEVTVQSVMPTQPRDGENAPLAKSPPCPHSTNDHQATPLPFCVLFFHRFNAYST